MWLIAHLKKIKCALLFFNGIKETYHYCLIVQKNLFHGLQGVRKRAILIFIFMTKTFVPLDINIIACFLDLNWRNYKANFLYIFKKNLQWTKSKNHVLCTFYKCWLWQTFFIYNLILFFTNKNCTNKKFAISF